MPGRPRIVLGAVSILAGWNAGKEYAELEWPFDLAITARLGRLRGRLFRHDREAQGRRDLHFQLVLRRADHRRGDAAHRQQPGDARDDRKVLFAVRRRPGCRRAVVVRPQCRRLPADRRLSRNALLLPPEAGRAADLELPAVDRRVLGVRLHLHLGGAAPPALSRRFPSGCSRSAWS